MSNSWPDTILQHPALSAADWRTLAAIARLGADSLRDDIAQIANVSITQVSRSTKVLKVAGLLEKELVHKHEKTRNTYDLAMLPNGHTTPPPMLPNGHTTPSMRVNNGAKLPNGHTMHDMYDDDEKSKEISMLLSFLDTNGRAKLLELPHVTPKFARAWRDHKQYKDLYNDWGKIKNPAGYIYREMERGNWPAVQQALPEDSVELPLILPYIGKVDSLGRTYQEDGSWR